MPLNIKNPATAPPASERARGQGVSKTADIDRLAALRLIRDRIAHLPERNSRSDEDIVGFDAHGIPD